MSGSGPVCLVLQPIHESGLAMLRAGNLTVIEGSDAGARPGDVVAVITRDAPVDAGFMARHKALRIIGKHGAGLDAIDTAHAARLGIAVVSTPGLNAQSVAEHAAALLLALARQLPAMTAAVRAGDRAARQRIAQQELHGQRLGLVGLGQIGRRIARIAGAGFGMQVRAYSPSVPDDIFAACGAQRADRLTDLLGWADALSVQVPGRAGEIGMIGAAELALLRPGALVVNVGRGGIIEEAAAEAAIRSGHLGGLGLDVMAIEPVDPAHPLLGLDNVIVTPHAGGSSLSALQANARRVAELVLEGLR